MSIENEQWTEDVFKAVFNTDKLDTLTPADFGRTMGREHASLGNDPTKWHLRGYVRHFDTKHCGSWTTRFFFRVESNARRPQVVLRMMI